jgi:hypothetical protein
VEGIVALNDKSESGPPQLPVGEVIPALYAESVLEMAPEEVA